MCPPGLFPCRKSRTRQRHCILASFACDGIQNCPQNQDEIGCQKTSIPAPKVTRKPTKDIYQTTNRVDTNETSKLTTKSDLESGQNFGNLTGSWTHPECTTETGQINGNSDQNRSSNSQNSLPIFPPIEQLQIENFTSIPEIPVELHSKASDFTVIGILIGGIAMISLLLAAYLWRKRHQEVQEHPPDIPECNSFIPKTVEKFQNA